MLLRNGRYKALTFSLLIHLLIAAIIVLTQIRTPAKFDKFTVQTKKITSIKSFLYHAPKIIKKEQKKIQNIIRPPKKFSSDQQGVKPPENIKSTSELVPTKNTLLDKNQLHDANSLKPSEQHKQEIPNQQQKQKKIDIYTQRQTLRSKLNRSAYNAVDSPYQRYQQPSAFNTNAKSVPNSVPIKDDEKEGKKNTQQMGSGISTTKGDDGVCSITQDMSVYGLSEGSSTQYFNCGESSFNKSFREHMKKVRMKLDKK